MRIIYKLIQNYGKLSKIIQTSEFLGRLLQMLMKVGLQLMENVLQLLANFFWYGQDVHQEHQSCNHGALCKLNHFFIISMRAAQIKDRAYSINFDEHKSIGTSWITLYVNGNNVTYFIVLVFWTFQNKDDVGNKNMATSICKIQT